MNGDILTYDKLFSTDTKWICRAYTNITSYRLILLINPNAD